MKTATLIPPCGGELINLLAEGEAVERLKDHASRLPSLQLTPRSVCDLELLATGAFSPLDRFMGRAAVSPYRATRDDVRSMVGAERFVEVFVDAPVEVCERRDTKGVYARARRGEINNLTGVDDPYESPLHPEVTLDTTALTPEECARVILGHLIERGFVRAAETRR